MTFFISQSLSQPGRPRTQAEQREIDRVNSELVAAFVQLGHSVATPWRSLQRALHVSQRQPARAARHEPRRRFDAGVVGLVPRAEQPADSARSCDLVSS